MNKRQIAEAIEYNRTRFHDRELVRHVQRSVGVDADGVWGPITVDAVASWQRTRGLVVDGMVGPNTWRALTSEHPVKPRQVDAGSLIVNGQRLEFEGVAWRNWLAPGIERFAAKRRQIGTVTEIVIHESVTRSRDTTQRVLLKKACGVHFIVDADGSISQHNDPALERLVHARGHNGPSIAIEVVGPYYPADDGSAGRGPWVDVIDAPWAHRGCYVVPPLAQLEALVELVRRLLELFHGTIPCHFHGADGDSFMLDSLNGRELADRAPGIWSHQQIGDHADGGFPTAVLWLVITRGLSVADALALAVSAATGARKRAEVE